MTGIRPAELSAEKVLAMLQVRNSDALPAWLAEELAGMFPAARRRILRIYPGKAARNPSVPSHAVFAVEDPRYPGEPVLVGVDSLLQQAIRDSDPLCVGADERGKRLLLRLASAGEVRYLVELSGAPEFAGQDRLWAFARVASCYYERLVDAETDPLTRLANRRALYTQVDAGVRAWISSPRAYFFSVIDIDHFKRVNDEFGHLYGDEILVRFADLLRLTFRSGDLIYRFGGEEFMVIHGVEKAADGVRALDRLRSAVEEYAFPGVGRVTVSIGYTAITDSATPATTLIDRADKALYHAKAHGRNRIGGWEDLVAAGELVAPKPGKQDVTLF